MNKKELEKLKDDLNSVSPGNIRNEKDLDKYSDKLNSISGLIIRGLDIKLKDQKSLIKSYQGKKGYDEKIKTLQKENKTLQSIRDEALQETLHLGFKQYLKIEKPDPIQQKTSTELILDIIQAKMKKNSISVAKLSIQLCVHHGSLTNQLSGNYNCRMDTLEQIFKGLNLDILNIESEAKKLNVSKTK